MLLKKVKWKNHEILGNLELDFCNQADSSTFQNVILVGENGTGKTTILETLSEFLSKGTFEPFEYIDYSSNSQDLKAVRPQNPNQTLVGAYDMINGGSDRREMHTNSNNLNPRVDDNPLNIRFDGCVYSKARADFKTKKITSTTTSELDVEKYDTDSGDDFTLLKQLLVDIQNQDNSDYTEKNKIAGSNPISWQQFYQTSRIYRFKNAFDKFFDGLKYVTVKDLSNSKEIIFEKNGKEISIDLLSTGEKQIVFRGSHLLKNSYNTSQAAVMVDEPELSMHPKWQRKILSYYKSLFFNGSNQTAQILFASHSDHVVMEALKNRVTDLVIVLSESNGFISAQPIVAPNILPNITTAETNFLAFGIYSQDYHTQLFGYLQHKIGSLNVKQCDTHIKNSANYVPSQHAKSSPGQGQTTYDTLPTLIRNQIHHPPQGTTQFSEIELQTSTDLLIKLCQ